MSSATTTAAPIVDARRRAEAAGSARKALADVEAAIAAAPKGKRGVPHLRKVRAELEDMARQERNRESEARTAALVAEVKSRIYHQ
jgi:hypothetical protein